MTRQRETMTAVAYGLFFVALIWTLRADSLPGIALRGTLIVTAAVALMTWAHRNHHPAHNHAQEQR